MALPVIADTIRCTVFGTVEGGVGWSNTFHMRKAAGDTFDAAILDLAPEITKLYQQNAYGAGKYGWAQFNSDGTKANGATFTPLDGSSASSSSVFAISGISAQISLPGQNAMAITLVTGLRGRSHRGRVFWTLTSREVLVDGGKVDSGDTAGCSLAWDAFRAACGAKTHPTTLVVASYTLAQAFACTSQTPRAVAAHQTRRRGRGA